VSRPGGVFFSPVSYNPPRARGCEAVAWNPPQEATDGHFRAGGNAPGTIPLPVSYVSYNPPHARTTEAVSRRSRRPNLGPEESLPTATRPTDLRQSHRATLRPAVVVVGQLGHQAAQIGAGENAPHFLQLLPLRNTHTRHVRTPSQAVSLRHDVPTRRVSIWRHFLSIPRHRVVTSTHGRSLD
jgi:hypothetical protein